MSCLQSAWIFTNKAHCQLFYHFTGDLKLGKFTKISGQTHLFLKLINKNRVSESALNQHLESGIHSAHELDSGHHKTSTPNINHLGHHSYFQRGKQYT